MIKAATGAALGAISAGAGAIGAAALRANKRIADKKAAKKRDKAKVKKMSEGSLVDMTKSKNVTVGGGLSIYDDDYVTAPKASFNVKKGKTTITSSVEKPFSKKDNRNISSELQLGIERGDESGGFSLTGSKRGKSKNLQFQFSKTFKKGGGADTGTVGERRSKIGVAYNKAKRQGERILGPKARKERLKQIKGMAESYMNRENIKKRLESEKSFQQGRRELFKSTAGKKIPVIKKGGMTSAYTGSYIKSEIDGKKISNKSYEKYYKGMI